MDSKPELPSITFNDGGEERTIFTLPPADNAQADSVLIFALPKSGSVLLDAMMRAAAHEVGLKHVAIMTEFFRLGLPDQLVPASTSAIFLRKGYCYSGFRYFPTQFDIPILNDVKKILLVRDPRDMLVSFYFSVRTSHPSRGQQLKSSVSELPHRDIAQTLDIDNYVLKLASPFKTMMGGYKSLCQKSDVKIYRYEDVIYNKGSWLKDMVHYFDWDIADAIVSKIAKKNDVFPEAENAARHIRQVHPGNYKDKLKPDTVAELDERFADEMQYFGYCEARSPIT